MNLLSVDFDFFFPELSQDPKVWQLYDWGHRDGGYIFLEYLWYTRAAAFIRNGLPLPQTSGDEKGFWSRFKFTPSCKLYYADSHMQIYNEAIQKKLPSGSTILNFDAHHDGGYRPLEKIIASKQVTCADWAAIYQVCHDVITKTVYPKWKTWAFESEPYAAISMKREFDNADTKYKKPFGCVFVCRSGGWTPSWLDDAFDAFVRDCPIKEKINLGVTNRSFDMAHAQKEAEMLQQMQAQASQSQNI